MRPHALLNDEEADVDRYCAAQAHEAAAQADCLIILGSSLSHQIIAEIVKSASKSYKMIIEIGESTQLEYGRVIKVKEHVEEAFPLMVEIMEQNSS